MLIPHEPGFLLTILAATFLVAYSILQWKMSQSDSFPARLDDEFFCVLLNEVLIECPSDISDVLIFLTTWKNIKDGALS